MAFTIDLRTLTSQVFNTQGYQVVTKAADSPSAIEYDVPTLFVDSAATATSLLGTPVFEQLIFSPLEGSQMVLDCPLIDLQRAKRIVKTNIAGLDGAVKELIAMDDFEITIRGVFVTPDSLDLQPLDAIAELYALFEIAEAIPVASELLSLLGIYSLVIERIRLPDAEGFPSVQAYELDCVSDSPFELLLR